VRRTITCAISRRECKTIKAIGETVRIVCLHTADSNIALFDAAARAAGFEALELAHVVRAASLAA
jgi:hypothetical protein